VVGGKEKNRDQLGKKVVQVSGKKRFGANSHENHPDCHGVLSFVVWNRVIEGTTTEGGKMVCS